MTLLLLWGCASEGASRRGQDYTALIVQAKQHASTSARAILTVSDAMVKRGEIVRGGCWDYLDRAFRQAGYPPKQRAVVFRGTKQGVYAPLEMLQAGDWLYHVNHSYGGIEHSGMFIAWVNREQGLALMLSYAGERRAEPARYKVYDLSSVYRVIRATP